MAKEQSGFVTDLLDSLSGLGDVSARAMFGGYSIYHQGVIFGLVVKDVFYLKATDENRGDFEARGLSPFTYDSKEGKQMSMPYWQVPADVMESPRALVEWSRRSYAAVVKAKETPKPKKPSKKKSDKTGAATNAG